MSDPVVEKFGNVEGLRKAVNNAAHHLQPPPDLQPSEWSEQNIRIPVGNAVPGLIDLIMLHINASRWT